MQDARMMIRRENKKNMILKYTALLTPYCMIFFDENMYMKYIRAANMTDV